VRDHLSSWIPPTLIQKGGTFLISKEKGRHTRVKGVTDSIETYTKRQRKKALSQAIVRRLLPFEASRMQSQYQRAMSCGNVVEQRDGKLTTWYCKTRPCLVCNGIRTAMLIDAYKPIVETWSDPALVTLTVPSPHLDNLRETLQEMTHQLNLIVLQLRRAGMDVRGVRVIESTEGDIPDHAHPHFHVLVSEMAVGRAIVQRWLQRYPKAVRSAQDVTKADTGTLKELFKYVTKLSDPKADPKTLDGILSAVHRLHLVRPFGFKLKRDPMDDEAFDDLVPVNVAFKRPDESVLWIWYDEIGNWVDHATGEMLVDTVPPFGLSGFA